MDNIEYRIREEAKAEATRETMAAFGRAMRTAIGELAGEIDRFHRERGLSPSQTPYAAAERRYRHLYQAIGEEFAPPLPRRPSEDDGG